VAKIPIPLEASIRMSERAVIHARANMARRGWSDRTTQAIAPMAEPGLVRIRSTAKHVMFQNLGIKPFLMTQLEGKTVPIKGRLFRVKGVGLPGMGYQDRKYNPIKGSIWREQRWRHPGIRPEKFLENAISRAILEEGRYLRNFIVDEIKGDD